MADLRLWSALRAAARGAGMWPERRTRPEGVVGPRLLSSSKARPEAWAVLPAIQRALADPITPTAPLNAFTSGLAGHQDPSFLSPLTHAVASAASGGLVNGLADLAPGSPQSYLGSTELTVRTVTPKRGRAAAVQRSVPRSGVTWTSLKDGPSDPDVVRWEHPSASEAAESVAIELSGTGFPDVPLTVAAPRESAASPAPPLTESPPLLQRAAAAASPRSVEASTPSSKSTDESGPSKASGPSEVAAAERPQPGISPEPEIEPLASAPPSGSVSGSASGSASGSVSGSAPGLESESGSEWSSRLAPATAPLHRPITPELAPLIVARTVANPARTPAGSAPEPIEPPPRELPVSRLEESAEPAGGPSTADEPSEGATAPLSGFAAAISTLQEPQPSSGGQDSPAESAMSRAELPEGPTLVTSTGPSTGSGHEVGSGHMGSGHVGSGDLAAGDLGSGDVGSGHAVGSGYAVGSGQEAGSGHPVGSAHRTGSGHELVASRALLTEEPSLVVPRGASKGPGHDVLGSGHVGVQRLPELPIARSAGSVESRGVQPVAAQAGLVGSRGLRTQLESLSSATPAPPTVQRISYVDVTPRSTPSGHTSPSASNSGDPIETMPATPSGASSPAVQGVRATSRPGLRGVTRKPDLPEGSSGVSRTAGPDDALSWEPTGTASPRPEPVTAPTHGPAEVAASVDHALFTVAPRGGEGQPESTHRREGQPSDVPRQLVRPDPSPPPDGADPFASLPVAPTPLAIVQREAADRPAEHTLPPTEGVSFATMFADPGAFAAAARGYTAVNLPTPHSTPSFSQVAQVQRLSLPKMPDLPLPKMPELPLPKMPDLPLPKAPAMPAAATDALERAGAASEAITGATSDALSGARDAVSGVTDAGAVAAQSAAQSAARAVAGAAGAPGAPAAGADLDEMARRLFEPLSARLRTELWLDRERAGWMSDARP